MYSKEMLKAFISKLDMMVGYLTSPDLDQRPK